MCILQTVGPGGRNTTADVKSLQLLLGLSRGQHGVSQSLAIDGVWGATSSNALASFRQGMGIAEQGLLAPADVTLDALRAGLPDGVPAALLWAVMINGSAARIEAFHQPLLAALERYGIDTPLRIAHFLAQVAHESGCLRYTEEIANGQAYEGRKDLGNLQPGDGVRFKGRGLIQLTGRANYRAYGQHCQRDFEADDPAQVSHEPALAVDVAGWFWWRNGLNEWADQDDLRQVTRRINGGYNGLDDRAFYLARARWLLRG